MKKNIFFLAFLSLIAIDFSACTQRVVYIRRAVVVRPARVAVVATIPQGGAVVVHGGVSYHYVNGVYYRPYGTGFTVVAPPAGIHVNVLPAGFIGVAIGGRPYFYVGGVYYTQVQPNVYEVVQKPAAVIVTMPVQGTAVTTVAGAVVTSLPEGTAEINLSGKHYYKVNDTYYEKFTSENGSREFQGSGQSTIMTFTAFPC